jgi:hypothetical protein
MAADTFFVLLRGVSKLPNGGPATAELNCTWIFCGELDAPGAFTVIAPLGPAVTLIISVVFPTPEVGKTVILD